MRVSPEGGTRMNLGINPMYIGSAALCAVFLFPCDSLAMDSICPDYHHYDGVLKQGESKVSPGSFIEQNPRLSPAYGGFVNYSRSDASLSIYELDRRQAWKRSKPRLKMASNLIGEDKPVDAFYVIECLIEDFFEVKMANRPVLKECNESLDKIIARFKKEPGSRKILSKAHALQSKCKKRIMKIECLDMAEKLSTTGFKLEKQGDDKDASTMYKSAYEIRQKNLSGKDRLVATTLVNLARAETASENYQKAKLHYQKAIEIYKANPVKDDYEYQIALEGYAFVLRKVNQNKLADSVYDQIRKMK